MAGLVPSPMFFICSCIEVVLILVEECNFILFCVWVFFFVRLFVFFLPSSEDMEIPVVTFL